MKLGQLRDSIAHKWGDGNNYALQKRIELAIVAARATIIQRRYDSTKIFPYSLIERATCVDLIQVEDCECACGCNDIKSVRTKFKVPKPLIVKDDSYFNFVGRGTTAFSYVPFHQVGDIKYRKFSKNRIFYSYFDDYIYIINANSLKELDFAEVPDNIVEFSKYKNCSCVIDGEIIIEDSLVEGIEGLLETRRPHVEKADADSEVQVDI